MPAAIDHVAFAVESLDAAIAQYRLLLNITVAHRERIEEQGVEEAMLRVGESYVQLLQPLGPETPVGKFLIKRGPGLHHIGYRVADVAAAIAQFKAAGARMIDEHPRRGSRNTKIAFVHPSAMGGVLVELVEEARGAPAKH
ncbi:MAG: methylmalonyl-CoA epimerase [Planctomycetes bacterium]|nr:methylmalonyl-CoA epimerase [Planctomycetota bacterium]